MAGLGSDPGLFPPRPRSPQVRMSLWHTSLNTYSSTFRSRETHHASLTTGTGRAWGSRAAILTGRTLEMEGT